MSIQHKQLAKECVEFYREYCWEDVLSLADSYPKDRQSLWIEWGDLFRWNSDIAEDVLDRPAEAKKILSNGLEKTDLPVDVDLSDAKVRITDTNGAITRFGIGDIREQHLGDIIAVQCQLGKVSERKPRLKEACFVCAKCGAENMIPQPFSDTQEPVECAGCEKKVVYELNEQRSTWIDQRKIRLEAPPEAESDGHIIGYCLGDMADPPDVRLQNKAGSRVTVIGKLEADTSSLFGPGTNEPVPDRYFVPEAFVWGEDIDTDIDADEYRSDVQSYAAREDAIDLFARNIDPSLVVTDAWETAVDMALVYLFAAPRIAPATGDTIRGDVHMLFVTDPGMNKSDFASKVAELSPKAVLKSSEGMSSEVALTAAATRDGFGDDSWSIEPGALPKANNGHLILDEIDKGPDGFLNGVHDPLEGDQVLRVEKAGQEANLSTRCGFLALGNPVDGRFDPTSDIASQVDLHPALMSRFDLICTMEDTADESLDDEIAKGVLDSIDESARLDHGDLATKDADRVTGDVPRAVMKAWVQIAREEIQPMLTEAAKDRLREYYVDARQLNDDGDKPATTARTLVAGVRIAMAFARCELADRVTDRHAERAIELSKTVVGENFDPETASFDPDRTTEAPSSQQQRVNSIYATLSRADDPLSVEEIAERADIEQKTVEKRVKKMSKQGEIVQPETGRYRIV